MANEINPSHIMQVGSGFWSSKVLLTAVEFELFTKLADKPMKGTELASELGLHSRGIWDFFDSLVALGFLNREGNGSDGNYSNTEETEKFLNKKSPAYIGGILEMFNARLFKYWNDLGVALKTGKPQNEVKHGGKPIFEELYSNPESLEQFLDAMSGISAGNFMALAEKFDFSKYSSLCDVGGAKALLSSLVAARHKKIKCTSFDLPPVEPIAQKAIEAQGLADRVQTASGDFFKEPLPKADVITMGMILHDWNLEKKMHLIKSVYDALPDGGAFIAIENIIDDDRRKNAFGMLMSLNMLIEFGDAFDFTAADFRGWCQEVGFKKFDLIPLAGPASAVVAYK